MNNSFFTIPGPREVVLEKKHFDKIALIDADRYKHLVASTIGKELEMNIPRCNSRRIELIEERLSSIFSMYSAKGYIFCFSGKSYDTFRNHIGFERKYKGNRTDATPYEGKLDDMAYVVTYIQNQYPSLIFSDLEADDLVSMLQCEHTFVHSNDKDLNQIPGFHFDEDKYDLVQITEEQAFYNLCYQHIKGDSTDNIVGLFRYGDKKAKDIMDSVPLKQAPLRILQEYQKVHGLTNGTDMFCEMWMLVKLRKNRGEYFKSKYKQAFELLNQLI